MAVWTRSSSWTRQRVVQTIVAVVALIVAASWLSHWLGAASLAIAFILWAIVLAGLGYADGRLQWLVRHPIVERALDQYVGRPIAPARSSSSSRPAAASKPSGEPRSAEPDVGPSRAAASPDLTTLLGLDDVFRQIEKMSSEDGLLVRAKAPAVLILLIGPHGVGKTSCAEHLATRFHETGITKTNRMATISVREIPGLVDEQGPGFEDLANVSERMRAAVDGVLLLENIDQWAPAGTVAGEATESSGKALEAIGLRLLKLAHDYPRRVLVIGTVTEGASRALDPRRLWLGQLETRPIKFSHLDRGQRLGIALRLFADDGFELSPSAENVLAARLMDLDDGRPDFDNAHAVRRLVNSIIQENAANSGLADSRYIEADIVEQAGVGIS